MRRSDSSQCERETTPVAPETTHAHPCCNMVDSKYIIVYSSTSKRPGKYIFREREERHLRRGVSRDQPTRVFCRVTDRPAPIFSLPSSDCFPSSQVSVVVLHGDASSHGCAHHKTRGEYRLLWYSCTVWPRLLAPLRFRPLKKFVVVLWPHAAGKQSEEVLLPAELVPVQILVFRGVYPTNASSCFHSLVTVVAPRIVSIRISFKSTLVFVPRRIHRSSEPALAGVPVEGCIFPPRVPGQAEHTRQWRRVRNRMVSHC